MQDLTLFYPRMTSRNSTLSNNEICDERRDYKKFITKKVPISYDIAYEVFLSECLITRDVIMLL